MALQHDIESAHANLRDLISRIKSEKWTLDTEQDTRLKLINNILIDVLGWSLGNISAEPHVTEGDIDYRIHTGGNNQLVGEAKKSSTRLVTSAKPETSILKISGTVLATTQEAIEQAK